MFSAKFDAYFIYEYAAATGSKPKLNFRANDLLSFTWKKIQLKDSLQVSVISIIRAVHITLQFMKCSLDKLPTIMGLGSRVEKGFFAWRLVNDYPGLNYIGKIPVPYYFGIDRMTDDKKKLFWLWYTPLESDPYHIYDLKLEAIKYCRFKFMFLH